MSVQDGSVPGVPGLNGKIKDDETGDKNNGNGNGKHYANGNGKHAVAAILPEVLPAHSEKAEMAVLGAAMLSTEAADYIVDHLHPQDFYLGAHRTIFQTIRDLRVSDDPVDTLSVPQALRDREKLDVCGGVAYVHRLLDSVPTAAHVSHYARIVFNKAHYRRILDVAKRIEIDALEESLSARELQEKAETLIWEASRPVEEKSREFTHAKYVLDEAIDRYCNTESEDARIPSGFHEINLMLRGGWRRTHLTVLAARPGVGKTSLVCNFIVASLKAGYKTAFFSMDMAVSEIVDRINSLESGIPLSRLDRQDDCLTSDEIERLGRVMGEVGGWELYLNDRAALTLSEVRSIARRQKQRHGLDFLLIDYIQLMRGEGRRYDRKVDLYTDIAEGLKSLAKDLDIPILAISQLSREVDRREDKRPVMADIRESGGVEAAADEVILMYRAAYYQPQSRSDTDETEVIFGKNRHGATGTVKLWFKKAMMQFVSEEKYREYDE